MLVLDLAETELISEWEVARDAWKELAEKHEMFAFAEMTTTQNGFTYNHIVLASVDTQVYKTLKSKGGRPYALRSN